MRTHYLFVTGLLLSSAAHAQLGVRAGTNWAGQTTNPTQHLVGGSSQATTSQPGYQLGLTYRVPFHKRWALAPELYVSRERQQVRIQGGTGPDNSYEANYELSRTYLNLPVLLRLQLGCVYLEAGPQASLLLGGRGTGIQSFSGPWATTIFYNPVIDQAATDNYARFDAGICLGVGVRVAAGLGLNVRAYQGVLGSIHHDESNGGTLPQGSEQVYRQKLELALTYDVAALLSKVGKGAR